MNSLNKFIEELQGLHLNISALESEIINTMQSTNRVNEQNR